MIIQIRGTSGSGKSTVMRKVMLAFPVGCDRWSPVQKEGRKQPLYYARGDIAIAGHYESPCGGCDTIGSARQVFELLQTELKLYKYVLCEGLLLSEDVKWTSQLRLTNDLRVVFLTTPLETCLVQIGQRRAEAGNDKPLNVKNTSNRVATIERARLKLEELGVRCVRASSDQAPKIILKWLSE